MRNSHYFITPSGLRVVLRLCSFRRVTIAAVLVWIGAPVVGVLVATPAAAQSTYIGGSLVGDIARFGKLETGDTFSRLVPPADSSIDGETLGFGITAGRALGERWGVELEFVRSGEIENRSTRRLGPILIPTLPTLPTLPGLPGTIPIPFPDFEIELETELQHTTIGALAWVRHDVGDRMELSYLGGISFIRSELESHIGVNDPRFDILSLVPESKAIEYQAGPAVGIDASFKFGDHVAVVTGLRMLALTAESRSGWLIRPAAGVRWRF